MNEGAYFQREIPAHSIAEYYDLLGNKSLGDHSGMLKTVYDVKDTSEIFSRSQGVVGDYGFGAPARALARMATVKNEKVFLYYFTRTSINTKGKKIKCLHSTELPFVFGFTADNWQPYNWVNGTDSSDARLAEQMSDYWSNFARYGNPNGNVKNKKWPVWPLFDLKNSSYLEIGTPTKPMAKLPKVQYDIMD